MGATRFLGIDPKEQKLDMLLASGAIDPGLLFHAQSSKTTVQKSTEQDVIPVLTIITEPPSQDDPFQNENEAARVDDHGSTCESGNLLHKRKIIKASSRALSAPYRKKPPSKAKHPEPPLLKQQGKQPGEKSHFVETGGVQSVIESRVKGFT
ncbi:uncharacterized protein F5147DRAFT_808229 [Suillus discolor]|uniref:Uncharacterized protein n=1 Tax=Suillus discolor TaxID=1912936 RepID=A0A9P7JRR2_9AGAM|nr:uncharacterized protein F5147DRAFT_808229 [Suillus discolor]KAG2104018.1 hypothetical protein F5147DRAFT_808229 [Suillus discolor]